ncbi:MAG: DNA translocase FtsK 4TM domain-containing protein [Alphaproteobacteria bacterium]|nr:DNA translocase FtsK 4TM domain-containing protein [Alphaproteobacteria bacterium]
MPQPMQAFLARRFVDIFALVFALSGLFVLSALLSYTNEDPSWNTAGGDQGDVIQNWMGAPGAWVSDILLQTIGLGSFAFALVLLVWGVRTFNRQSLSPLWLRIVALIAAAVVLSVAGARIPSGGWTVHPYLGSAAGTLIFEKTVRIGDYTAFWPGPGLISALSGVLGLTILLFAAAVRKEELSGVWRLAMTVTIGTLALIIELSSAFRGWIRAHNDPADGAGVNIWPNASLLERFRDMRARIHNRVETSLPVREAPKIGAGKPAQPPATPNVASLPVSTPISAPSIAQQPQNGAGHIPVVTPQLASTERNAASAQQRFNLSDTKDWEFPPLSLLQAPLQNDEAYTHNEAALRRNAELLQNVLADFNIQGEITSIHPGPVVTLYELEPAPGTKSARVISLSDDIARSMSAVSVRVAVVPGRNVIGIELPNKTRQIVYMQELLASRLFEKTSAKLPLILGKDIGGQPILADLAKMPHLLVAGTTGSGKSVAVNTMILSLLFCLSPEKCRFIMIDPKMLELSVYDGIPHLLSPVVTEPGKAVVALKWTVHEMEERYRAMSKLGVRNIEGYNARLRDAVKKGETLMTKVQTGFDPENGRPVFEDQPMDMTELPYIVVVVDEFADLMLVAGKDVESAVQRLAQMARAAGIHLIMATQRPSVDVITGVVKANFPTRISFQVTSKIDSRTILGEGGAEQLLGMGDMLYMAPGGRITRVHGPFVSDNDVESAVAFLKAQGAPAYIDGITDGEDSFGDSELMMAMFGGGKGGNGDGDQVDELYDQAVAIVAREGKASTSFVQRYLQIGYNRAARIIEEMERQGVISKANATGKREVLVRDLSDA